jgi:AcrR family transcriptional regulator
MAKPGKRPASAVLGEQTRARIVDAGLATLKDRGYAATSTRAVAARGGFTQASIFYHFGNLNEVLLGALDRTSEERMARYRSAIEQVHTVPELIEVAAAMYLEDLDGDHLAVLAELIAASSSSPELGPEIAARMEPWVRLIHDAVARVLHESPLKAVVPQRDIAFGVVALYVGAALLTRLTGDTSDARSLFATATRVGSMAGALLGGTAWPTEGGA